MFAPVQARGRSVTRPSSGARVSQTASTPPPVGGWNARDAVSAMPIQDALQLDNFWPTPSDVMLRKGYTQFCTGFGSVVESLMSYQSPGGTSTLFAASGTAFYTVASGAVAAAVVTGLTNARWDAVNYTNSSAASYLCAFNGVDAPRYWDGSAWTAITGASTPAITGVTTTKLKAPMVHKRRLWFIEDTTLKAWYLPVDAVGGAANAIDLAGIMKRGGALIALGSWTIDGGDGVDDYWVAVSTMGEVVTYRGTDPSAASTWTLQGVWQMGRPIGGTRCLIKYGGDLLYSSSAGVVPLALALQSATVDRSINVSDKIQKAMQDATDLYGATFGWCMMYYPAAQMLLVNVPTLSGSLSDQYVMNTVSMAWARFKDIYASCWCDHAGIPYFGGSTFVGQFWQVYADNSNNINGDVTQAFSYFGSPGQLKSWLMARMVLLAESAPAVTLVMNTDFATGLPISTATFSGGVAGLWDSGVWDVDVWGSDLNVYRDWQTISGYGQAGALRAQVSAKLIEVRWQATDWVFEAGGVL